MLARALLILAAVLPVIAAGEIYRWVDGSGVVHYSDHPVAGAVSPELPNLTRIEVPPARAEPRQARAAPVAAAIAVVDPAPGQTFHDAGAAVTVRLRLGTELSSGQTLHYRLDGRPAGPPTTDTQVTLRGVARGAHSVSAAIVAAGQAVIQAQPVTFYMSPPSVLTPLTQGTPDQQQPTGAPVVPPAGRAGGVLAAPRFGTGRSPP